RPRPAVDPQPRTAGSVVLRAVACAVRVAVPSRPTRRRPAATPPLPLRDDSSVPPGPCDGRPGRRTGGAAVPEARPASARPGPGSLHERSTSGGRPRAASAVRPPAAPAPGPGPSPPTAPRPPPPTPLVPGPAGPP